MAKIEYLSKLQNSDGRSLQRIVAAARAEPGLWLMVKERELELRAIRTELQRVGAVESEIDRLFPQRLKPALSELAAELVTRMFGSCPPDMLVPVQNALLEAAKREPDGSQQEGN